VIFITGRLILISQGRGMVLSNRAMVFFMLADPKMGTQIYPKLRFGAIDFTNLMFFKYANLKN